MGGKDGRRCRLIRLLPRTRRILLRNGGEAGEDAEKVRTRRRAGYDPRRDGQRR